MTLAISPLRNVLRNQFIEGFQILHVMYIFYNKQQVKDEKLTKQLRQMLAFIFSRRSRSLKNL